jgi:DNA-binding transcriptional ArsR family regulator
VVAHASPNLFIEKRSTLPITDQSRKQERNPRLFISKTDTFMPIDYHSARMIGFKRRTFGALTSRAGVSQPAVSKHLGVLKQAGLVRDRHEGRQTHYSARLGALAPLIDWTSKMAGFWQNRFDHLEDLLKRIDQ